MFLGVIPPLAEGGKYGEYIVYANIPRSSTNSTIRTIFTTDKSIDHALITRAATDTGEAPPISLPASTPVVAAASIPEIATPDVEVINYSQLTWEFGNGGAFSLSSLTYDPLETKRKESDILARATIKTTKAVNGATSKTIKFEAVIKPTAADTMIEIERQPLFGKVGEFVNWDSGSGKAAATTNAGVKIPMDWYLSDDDVDSKVNFKGGARVTGVGKPNTDGGKTKYGEVLIQGEIAGITHGNKDTLAKLDLLNFLSLHTL